MVAQVLYTFSLFTPGFCLCPVPTWPGLPGSSPGLGPDQHWFFEKLAWLAPALDETEAA